MQEKLTDLEIRMAYLESTLDQLNEVVIRQQGQIDLLTAEVIRQKEQLENGAEFVRPLADEPPPPHY